ncbi:MAG: sugar phosphate isomerase/epimerase [Erythrobacter sp.]|nr:sugar phosphate isomerase/epimerase [Erythrobacter sp.]
MITLDRRMFVGALGAAGLGSLLGGCGGAQTEAASTPFFERIGKPIGLQLYALVGQDPVADPAALFAQVAAMGYGEIELPNLLGQEPAALKAAADAAGLPIASLHVPAVPFAPGDGLTFQHDPDEVAAIAATLGGGQLVIPFPVLPDGFSLNAGEDFPSAIARAFAGATLEHWQATAQRFNAIGQAMKDRGVTVAYHNHNLEFAPLGETTAWQVLLSETDPEHLKLQLDLGWVAQAGLDPETVMREAGSRVTSLHVKDVAEGGAQSFYFGATPTEVGAGRLDWAAILPAAEELGVAHYFVEQEPPFAIPREEAMQRSVDFLRNLVA